MTPEDRTAIVRIFEHDGRMHELHAGHIRLLEEAFRRLAVKLNRIEYQLRRLERDFEIHLQEHG